jgi:multiple sugar transport system substrate-binding protein
MMNYRGRIWALPTTPASTALHYNRRLFREAGLDPDKPPQTIREMEIFIEKMTRREKDGRFVVSGFLPDEPGWWNWGWGYIFGGRLWDEKSQITANCPENIRAFEWIQSFAKRYGTKNLQTFKSGFGTFSSPQNAFLTEKVAMEIQGVWMSNFISQFNPKLDWAASPFPYPDDRPDLKGHTFVDVDVLMIPRGAKHPNEAFEFIRFVQSQRGMELLNLLQRKHTPLIAVSEAFWKKHPNPYIKLFTELPRKGPTFTPPKMALWPEYQAELNSAFDEIMLLKATPKEALDRVQARMQPKLDEYLERIRLREAAGKSHLAGREDLPR